ncbi:hypothetical protein NE237_030490 [Protea cynaroides]|uniref:Uncharacterized protein n=1 Tax=Protea cynaroides TaxID=273540 RepID=A0A9Q0JXA0_9MAGN|nr:hypothetical protein NE237_030490 [Protea cynaroides]
MDHKILEDFIQTILSVTITISFIVRLVGLVLTNDYYVFQMPLLISLAYWVVLFALYFVQTLLLIFSVVADRRRVEDCRYQYITLAVLEGLVLAADITQVICHICWGAKPRQAAVAPSPEVGISLIL